MKELATNKRAFFDYQIAETIEAGLVLTGQEVKSAKTGGATLTGSYAKIMNGEAFVINMNIKPYSHASNLQGYDSTQTRKPLLHKSEIIRLASKGQQAGLILLPLAIYVSKGKVKIKLGLGRARKKSDKRELLRRREDEKQIRQAVAKRI